MGCLRRALASLLLFHPLLRRRKILKESQREAKPLLYNQSPFPLSRGRGTKGDGVTKWEQKRSMNNILGHGKISRAT